MTAQLGVDECLEKGFTEVEICQLQEIVLKRDVTCEDARSLRIGVRLEMNRTSTVRWSKQLPRALWIVLKRPLLLTSI